jgi:O6-methylguanine-DNA--protein-cysteine methyltransferase
MTKDLKEKIVACIQRHPGHRDWKIARNTKGANVAMVQKVRESMGGTLLKTEDAGLSKLITLGAKPVLDHRPPETVLKYLRKIPIGKAETLEDFAKRIGRSKDKVRQDAKSHGCCKWVDRGTEDWELVVMNPETAKHYND